MLATREPLGRFIVQAHSEKGLISKPIVMQEIDDLIDLIKIRIQNKSISKIAETFHEKIFELRFDIIEWFADQNKSVSEYLLRINQEIANKLQISPYSDLAASVVLTWEGYEKVFSSITEKLNIDNFEQYCEELSKSKPTYETIKLHAYHPSPQIQYYKKWIDASLDIDFALILSDLILTDKIKLSEDKIIELIQFLKDTTIRYGAYSIFTGAWEPDIDDTSNLTNRIKVLAATIEMDNKIYYKISKEGLYNLIQN